MRLIKSPDLPAALDSQKLTLATYPYIEVSFNHQPAFFKRLYCSFFLSNSIGSKTSPLVVRIMKYAIMLCTIFSINSFTNAQLVGIYSIPDFDNKVECNLFLYSTNNYFLELSESLTTDIVHSMVISYGSYSVHNNELILLDKVHNYKICLARNHDTLTTKRSFKLLNDMQFILISRDLDAEPLFISSRLDRSTFVQDRLKYRYSINHEFNLKFGIYRSKDGLSLFLLPNNRYVYKYREITISEGTWNRNRNELELIDSALNHPFYVLIGEEILLSKLLPGDFRGAKLIFVKKPDLSQKAIGLTSHSAQVNTPAVAGLGSGQDILYNHAVEVGG